MLLQKECQFISKVIDRHLKHANSMHTEAWPIGSFGFTTIEDNLNIHEDPYVIMHQAVKCFGRFSNLLRHIKMCYFYNNNTHIGYIKFWSLAELPIILMGILDSLWDSMRTKSYFHPLCGILKSVKRARFFI